MIVPADPRLAEICRLVADILTDAHAASDTDASASYLGIRVAATLEALYRAADKTGVAIVFATYRRGEAQTYETSARELMAVALAHASAPLELPD